MVMQMKMMYRGLCKLFDSCLSVTYTPTVYFILLQKFDKNSYLIHKKAVCCRMVQGGLELHCRSDG